MKYINAVAPIAIDQIKEYFKDKNTMFIIDYNESKLQDKVFLTYLSNLDIPCDINFDTTPREKVFQLLASYTDIKNICNIPVLNVMIAEIILKSIGVNSNILFSKDHFTNEEIYTFIENNKDTLIKWLDFIDSSMVFLLYSYKDLNEKLKVEESFEVIDDHNYVGLNVVNLFKIPGFLELYFSSTKQLKMLYFKQQFETYMFKGKAFFEYYNNDVNVFVPLLAKLITKEMPLEPEFSIKD